MKKRLFIPVVFLLALFQVAWLGPLRLFGAKPDLFLLALVLAVFYFNAQDALLLGILIGMLKDIFAVNALAINVLFFPALSLLLLQLKKRLSLEQLPLLVLFTFLASLFYSLLIRLAFHYQNNLIFYFSFWRIAFLSALYSALILPLLLRSLDKVNRP
jgi:rod shape-determining protein MreD